MIIPRYLEKFVWADGVTTLTFPKKLYMLDDGQALRLSTVAIAGASYPYDQLGAGIAPKDLRRAAHRFAVVVPNGIGEDAADFDDDVQEIRRKLRRGGAGKLYTVDGDGNSRRWAWARAAEMPASTWRAGELNLLNLAIPWQLFSDFNNETSYGTNFVLASNPETIVVANPGDATVYDAVIYIKGTFTNPSLVNTTNDYEFATTRDGSNANHWLRIKAGVPSVHFSTDGGATWAGDYALVTLPDSQVQLMVLEPGNNSIDVAGVAVGSTVRVEFDIPWE